MSIPATGEPLGTEKWISRAFSSEKPLESGEKKEKKGLDVLFSRAVEMSAKEQLRSHVPEEWYLQFTRSMTKEERREALSQYHEAHPVQRQLSAIGHLVDRLVKEHTPNYNRTHLKELRKKCISSMPEGMQDHAFAWRPWSRDILKGIEVESEKVERERAAGKPVPKSEALSIGEDLLKEFREIRKALEKNPQTLNYELKKKLKDFDRLWWEYLHEVLHQEPPKEEEKQEVRRA